MKLVFILIMLAQNYNFRNTVKNNIYLKSTICTIFISILSCSYLCGQTYITGIAADSIDILNVKGREFARDGKFEDAVNTYKTLLDYWQTEYTRSKSTVNAQNYFLSFTQYYWNKMDVDMSKDEVILVTSREQEIINVLSRNDLVTFNYYRLCGRLVSQLNGERERGLRYLLTAEKILLDVSPDSYDKLSQIKVNIGNNHIRLTNYDEAVSSFQEARNYSMKVEPLDYFLLNTAVYSQAAGYYYKNDYDAALEKFEESLEISKAHLDNRKDDIRLTRSLGVINYQQGHFEKALEYFLAALAENKKEYGENTPDIAGHYEAISNAYDRLGDRNTAMTYIDSALISIDRIGTQKRAAILLNNKANLSQNPNSKIRILNEALNVCPEDPSCIDFDANLILVNLGEAYRLKGNYQSALNYNLLSKKFYEDNYEKFGNRLNVHYASLSMIYLGLEDVESAIKYQKKAIEVSREFRPEESAYVAGELARLGNLYIIANDLDASENILNKALQVQKNSGSQTQIETIMARGYLAKIYKKRNQLNKAKNNLLTALDPLLNDKRREPNLRNEYLIDLAKIHIESGQIDSAKIIVSQLLNYNDIDESNLHSFRASGVSLWSTFNAYIEYLFIYEQLENQSTTEIIEKIEVGLTIATALKENFFFESSEIEFQKRVRDFIDWSIKTLSTEWKETNKDECLSLLFDCIEFDKSVFSSTVLAKNAIQEDLVSEVFLLREKALVQDYENIYQKFNAGTFSMADSILIGLENEMHSLQQKKESFLDSLELLYPKYYNNKYNPKLSRLNFISNEAKEKNIGFLNYYWNDTLLHCLAILPDHTEYFVVNTQKSEKSFSQLDSLVTFYNTNENLYHDNKELFINYSNNIYKLLFSKLANKHLPFELIIIPDGKLVYLSFDMLIDSIPNGNVEYGELPYLIHKHLFSYVGSCSEYLNISNEHSEFKHSTYLGFSPEYQTTTKTAAMSRSTIEPLLYNSLEIETGKALFGGKTFDKNQATEYNFKNVDTKHKILHLAMHTTIEDKFPQDSYLNFSIDTSSSEDGKLHIYEIAKMNLNANLVILSACETNKGKEINGQGVLGIARAFQKAFCPNIIVSNWSIDDHSTSQIVSSCLKNLKDSFRPNVALRKSKLDFIEHSSTLNSHPKYWAAFSFYGNPNTSINGSRTNKKLLYTVLCFAFLLLSFFSLKRFFTN